MIQKMEFDIYIFLDNFYRNICLLWNLLAFSFIKLFIFMWDKIETESKVTKTFHSLSNCGYTRVIFVFFSDPFPFTQVIFCKRCTFRFSKYSYIFNCIGKISLNIFAILISLSIVQLFSVNLIVFLALILFEKKVWHFARTFCYLKHSLHEDLQNGLFLHF